MPTPILSTPADPPPTSPAQAELPPASAADSARTLVELAEAALAGDRPAFEAIHRRLAHGLRRLFLQRNGHREDLAEDLCQRTWMAVWQAFRDRKYDRDKSAVTTFVYAVGFKVWLQHLRRAGRSAEAATEAEALEALGPTQDLEPSSASHAAEAIEVMRACLRGEGPGSLDEHERFIVTEAAAGVPDRELASRLGIAPSTLNVRKQAALSKVRRYLAQRGFRTEDSGDRGAGSGE